jgi:hypothetical protein
MVCNNVALMCTLLHLVVVAFQNETWRPVVHMVMAHQLIKTIDSNFTLKGFSLPE